MSEGFFYSYFSIFVAKLNIMKKMNTNVNKTIITILAIKSVLKAIVFIIVISVLVSMFSAKNPITGSSNNPVRFAQNQEESQDRFKTQTAQDQKEFEGKKAANEAAFESQKRANGF